MIFVVVFVAVFVLLAFFRKKTATPAKYDERQQIVRGRAYRTAFGVIIAYLCLNGFYYLATGTEWADVITASFMGICLSITVFVIECIVKDAYFPVNQQPRFYFVLFIFISAVNLAIGIMNVIADDILTDGRLNYNAMSLVVAAMFFAIVMTLIIKRGIAKSRFNRGLS